MVFLYDLIQHKYRTIVNNDSVAQIDRAQLEYNLISKRLK